MALESTSTSAAELRADPQERISGGSNAAWRRYNRLPRLIVGSFALHLCLLAGLNFFEAAPRMDDDVANEIPVELVTEPPPQLKPVPKPKIEVKEKPEAKKEAEKPKPEKQVAETKPAPPPPSPNPQAENSQAKDSQAKNSQAKAEEKPKPEPKPEPKSDPKSDPKPQQQAKAEAEKPAAKPPSPPETAEKPKLSDAKPPPPPPKPQPPAPKPQLAAVPPKPPEPKPVPAPKPQEVQAKPPQPAPPPPKPKPQLAATPAPASQPAQALASKISSQEELLRQALDGAPSPIGGFTQSALDPALRSSAAKPGGMPPIPHSDDDPQRAVAVPSATDDGEIVVAYKTLVFSKLELAKRFPEEARKRHAHGSAVIDFLLDEKGHVLKVTLIQSSGDAALDAESQALVDRAAPFPPPPPGAQREFGAVIEFSSTAN